jgi:hypothetical protein
MPTGLLARDSELGDSLGSLGVVSPETDLGESVERLSGNRPVVLGDAESAVKGLGAE